MSWKETCRVNERERFVKRYEETGAMSALCREFGSSRKTGYKWAGPYFELGTAGLADHSRRPPSSPSAIDADLADALVLARKRYPFWGPRSPTICGARTSRATSL
jgi:transposase-like protein